ncbi:MAG: AAA family ATPase [Bacteriovoracia bacterium]
MVWVFVLAGLLFGNHSAFAREKTIEYSFLNGTTLKITCPNFHVRALLNQCSVTYRANGKEKAKTIFSGRMKIKPFEALPQGLPVVAFGSGTDFILIDQAGKTVALSTKGTKTVELFFSDHNGNKFVFVTKDGLSPKTYLIHKGPQLTEVAAFFATSIPSEHLKFDDNNLRIGTTTIPLSNLYSGKDKTEDTKKRGYSETTFEYKNQKYTVMSAKDDVEAGLAEGTYVVNPQGVMICFDYHYFTTTQLNKNLEVSRDGILSVKGAFRKIDLDRFYAEATHQTRAPRQVRGTEGPIDPFAHAKKIFRDISEEERIKVVAGKKSYLELDPDIEIAFRDARAGVQRKNALIVSDPGTGKSTDIRIYSRNIVEGKYEETPRTWKTMLMDMAAFSQGTAYIGSSDTNVNTMLAFSDVIPSMFFIDEIQNLRGNGAHSQNSNDTLQTLKPPMMTGELTVWGGGTVEEVFSTIGTDRAAIQRFRLIFKKQPDHKILFKQIINWLKEHNLPIPEDSVIEAVIYISSKYNPQGAQPRKAILLLDTIYSKKRRLVAYDHRKILPASMQDVFDAAKTEYNIDVFAHESADKEQVLERARKQLDEDVVGNEKAKDSFLEGLELSLEDVDDLNRPKGRHVLVGPAGTGKTQLAYSLALAIGAPLATINMNEFATEESFDSLLNAVGNAARKNALSVILFDEFEKAPLVVQNKLLQALETGVLTVIDTDGVRKQRNQVDIRNTTILFATNAGADFIKKRNISGGFGFLGGKETVLNQVELEAKQALVEDNFSEYVLDRAADINFCPAPTKKQFTEIIALHVQKTLKEITNRPNRNLQIKINELDRLVDTLASTYYNEEATTNREAIRIVAKTVRLAVARAIRAYRKHLGQEPNHIVLEPNECAQNLRPVMPSGS